ncbi:ligand-effect modulator 3 family [Cytidiella melzeri]|nr:ligand-effect modulator 3 family [Cytidiella melzeri]
MGLFRRNRAGTSSEDGADSQPKKEKGSWRKPANTAFKQQRLKAWQPILTPKTVLPALLLIGLAFAPIGGLLIWGSGLVTEITLDYTNCEDQSPQTSNTSDAFTNLSSYNYRLRAGRTANPSPPQYMFVDRSSDSSVAVSQQRQCVLRFEVPYDLEPTVLLYYKMTNFFQNHRRYVKSVDPNQLKGDYVSPSSLNSGDCKPITTINNKAVYPCGLIANSVFNDSYSELTVTSSPGNTYQWSETGIAWPGEANKYTASPTQYNIDDIVPPPNWALRFPNGYTNSTPPPNLKEDEHFQNWMRTAGLPTFSKLWGRNDDQTLLAGTYQIVIDLNYPVKSYHGTKSIVISTVSWIGGKNPFLGWAYVATAALFVLLAIAGAVRHLVRPRKLGDMSLLSWNRS